MREPISGGLARLHHSLFSPESIAAGRERSVTVCVPARNEAVNIGQTVSTLVELQRAGCIDQVLVADDSTDDTARIAEKHGAEVVRQEELLPEFGPVLGKGDAMWRALSVCSGEVICFVDGDSADFGPRLPVGLIGAVALGGFSFAKGTFRRPFAGAGPQLPTGGGRVTELTAKPLLRHLLPELAQFTQPLAGEIAADAALLRSVPMATGYSVDVALLADVWRQVGIEAMVEVDLDCRQNSHQPLDCLAPMSEQVALAILDRASQSGGPDPQNAGGALTNRPPMDSLKEDRATLPSAA